MKRYAVFTARFALAPMISGPFVVSMTGRASGLEWAHIVTGFATIYLIIGLLLIPAKNQGIRLPAVVALALGLLEAIPGTPRLHAAVSPVLFATLEIAPGRSRRVFVLPALVLLPILYGVGYRHQTSGIVAHLGAALPVAGLLLVCCTVLNERHPGKTKLRRACNLTIAAVLFQIVLGIVVLIVRLLEIEGGLLLAVARTAHITGAGPVLAASMELAIQYRRSEFTSLQRAA
jgi:heme A synthase